MEKSGNLDEKLDRKTVERNRRLHMKALFFKLASLIPRHHDLKSSKDIPSQQVQLDHAATYIKKLKERIEELKETKRQIMELKENNNNDGNHLMNNNNTMMFHSKLPMMELKDMGSSLEVVLISSAVQKIFMSHEIISIIEQSAAEVVAASYYTVGDMIFHSFHAQVKISRVGIDTSRIYQRLQELILSP